jgi:ABC-type cobalamin transport system permease subunit
MRDVVASIAVIVGIFVVLAGLLFFFQGIGVVHGSTMTDTTRWSVLGPIIALVGAAIAFAGWRLRKR